MQDLGLVSFLGTGWGPLRWIKKKGSNKKVMLPGQSKIASLDGISILRLDTLESPLPSPSSVRHQGKLRRDPFPDSPDIDFQHQCNNLCSLKLCIPIMEFSTNNVTGYGEI